MKLSYLQALRSVMEAGTVTGAAVRMRRSQPQISRLVSDLERELGFRVFARHKKRLIPTSEGREFYARSLHILDQLEEIPGIVREITGRSDAFLRIACQSYIAQALLPEALGKFVRTAPSLRFSVKIHSRAEMGEAVSIPPYDLAIVALPLDHSLLVRSEPFAIADVVAVLPRDHPLARNKTVKATDLTHEPFIALTSETLLRQEIDRMFSDLGLRLNIRGEASAAIATCQMVAQGLGFTLADPLEAHYVSSEKVAVRELTPRLCFSYGFLWPAMEGPTALTVRFAECVAETARARDPKHIKIIHPRGESTFGAVN
jgi:DNA-binding transcriptional LysR family regulator